MCLCISPPFHVMAHALCLLHRVLFIFSSLMGGCSGKIDLQTHGSKASKGSEQIGVRKASAASSDETPKEKENNARYDNRLSQDAEARD